MTTGEEPCGAQPAPKGLDPLAERWLALWREELAALAQDPAAAAAWQAMIAQGAAWTTLLAKAPSPDAAQRPAPGAASPGAGDDARAGGAELGALPARLDALERRLAALEGGQGGSPAPGRPARRRKRDG